ncbi:MAG: MerR family transcriptional regulator [Deinococcota bacterium]
MFKIGEFSKISQVSLRMLRHYDEVDLFKPVHSDPQTGYRYYSVTQLLELYRIVALRDMGFTIKEMKHILVDNPAVSDLQGLLEQQRTRLQDDITQTRYKLAHVEARLKHLAKEASPQANAQHDAPDVIVKRVPAQRIVSLREVTPRMEMAGMFMVNVLRTLSEHGIGPAGTGLAVFYDAHYETTDIDWEVGRPLSADVDEHVHGSICLDDGRPLCVHTLPEVPEMASWVIEGPYVSLFEAYKVLGEWLEAHDATTTGDSREVFLNISDTPANNITEVQFPLVLQT